MLFTLIGGLMKKLIFIPMILLSFVFSYEVGEQISINDQQLTKSVCYAPLGSGMTTGDDFNLYNYNGAYNGGEYHVIFMDLSASW